MRRASRTFIGWGILAIAAAALVVWWQWPQRLVTEKQVEVVAARPFPPKAFAPGEPPRLLPARVATTEQPVQAWERLLAADGSPTEDLAALGELVNAYVHAGLGAGSQPIGFNEDLIPTLTNRDALGDAALPADHPAIRDGRLIDRWGTPWQVHPLAKDSIQLRSAGHDRRLYTGDDLVSPVN